MGKTISSIYIHDSNNWWPIFITDTNYFSKLCCLIFPTTLLEIIFRIEQMRNQESGEFNYLPAIAPLQNEGPGTRPAESSPEQTPSAATESAERKKAAGALWSPSPGRQQ